MTKLLLVDDSAAIRGLIRDRIARSGLALDGVVEAASGRAALERLSSERDIGLVLCDLRLPDLDGLELVRTIRARFPRDRHRIVVVGSASDAAAFELAREAGADRAVERPFTSEEIRAELAAFCSAPALPSESAKRVANGR
jgi:CheY-like chemotaxis protein